MQLELTKLKMQLVCDKKFTFFATILFSLELIEDPSVKTACTDGRSIRFSPVFWSKLSKPEKMFLVFHEVMHVALNHITRLGTREPKRFNAACDYAINYDLVQAGYSMPRGGLCDKKYAGMTAEQIYDILPEEDYDESDIEFSDEEGLEEELEEILIRAGASALLAGTEAGCIPSSAERLLDELLNPQLPWEVIFQDLMLEHSTDDYSMEFPDEEYMPMNIYIPTLYSEGMGDITVFADVSGSVSQHDINVALSEVNSLSVKLKPKKLTLVSFDTAIQMEAVYEPHDHIDVRGINLNGGGGTSVREIYEHIEHNQPEIAVVITDGYYSEMPLNTSANMIYLIMDNPKFTTPNGRVIHVKTMGYKSNG